MVAGDCWRSKRKKEMSLVGCLLASMDAVGCQACFHVIQHFDHEII